MDTSTKIKTVTKEDLLRKMQRESPQIVNVLQPKDYKLGLIKGSKKIPLEDLSRRVGELDKKREVVTYCADFSCQRSRQAAELLAGKGFSVSAYEGGIKEWTKARFPVESTVPSRPEPQDRTNDEMPVKEQE